MDREQHTLEKLGNLAVGGAGVSLTFFDVANYAQAIGMILGAIIVVVQFTRMMHGLYKTWKRKKPANDIKGL